MTNTMEMASVTSHRTTPSRMMVPWLIAMPAAGQRVDRSADGERVDRRAEHAAAGAEQNDCRADDAVEARRDHCRRQQQVERYRFLAHAVRRAADGEDEHQDRNEHEFVALELLHQRGDAGIKRSRLGRRYPRSHPGSERTGTRASASVKPLTGAVATLAIVAPSTPSTPANDIATVIRASAMSMMSRMVNERYRSLLLAFFLRFLGHENPSFEEDRGEYVWRTRNLANVTEP